MKKCKKCGLEKNLSEFYKNKRTKDGLFPECKKCNIERTRKWQNENKEWARKIDNNRYYANREKRLALSKEVWANREWKGLREDILKRDGYKCVRCGMSQEEHMNKWGRDLNIDHINHDRKETTIDNSQTICVRCHGYKHAGEGYFALEEYRKNKSF